jgi:hypothetical protein
MFWVNNQGGIYRVEYQKLKRDSFKLSFPGIGCEARKAFFMKRLPRIHPEPRQEAHPMTRFINTPPEILWQIRQGKLNQLNRIFTALIMQARAADRFKSLEDEPSYIAFLGKFSGALKEIQGGRPLIGREFDSFPPEMAAKLRKTSQAMQKGDYDSPNDIDEQLMHLLAMWTLYKNPSTWPPTIEDVWLDYSYANLLVKVSHGLVFRAAMGGRELTRTKGSSVPKERSLY